jgi:predicted N-acyltransferase
MVVMDDDLTPHDRNALDPSLSDSAQSLNQDWTAEMVSSVSAIPASDWDRCAGLGEPLISHAFFTALEESGSANEASGWAPRHLMLKDPNGKTQGVLPLYLKTHSYGEYVFDHAWADAWARAGGKYYPKVQIGIPFTPVPGRRLLVNPDLDDAIKTGAHTALAEAALASANQLGLSSVHITFLNKNEHDHLTMPEHSLWISREGMQFHWHNRDYGDFDDFLSTLSSRKRKAIRRERRDIGEAGLSFDLLRGDDLKSHHWDSFYHFYLATIDRKWGGAYLTREFFDHIHQTMREHILLVIAKHDGKPVAGAINFIGKDTLYGRNWGSIADIPFLHFETCYYQAISYAITHGLKKVEAGAQGLHKVQRGYEPVPTYSVHHMTDPGFHAAVKDFTAKEARHIARERQELIGWLPYKAADTS